MMKYVFILLRSCVLGAILIHAPWTIQPAESALVTYQFNGTVTDVSSSLSTLKGHGANGFAAGLRLSGAYTFDSKASGVMFTVTDHMMPIPVTTTVTTYVGAITSLNLSLGTYAPMAVGYNHFNVVTGQTANYHVYHEIAGNLVQGIAPSLFDIFLADVTGTAFSKVSLPGAPAPDLQAFPVRQWTLGFSNGDSVRGSLDSLQAVPLPPSYVLFGAGVIALLVLGIRHPIDLNSGHP